MCETCGCGDTTVVPVDVHERILSDNDRQARHLREHFIADRILALNVMGSPGSGKTALLEATGHALAGKRVIGALAGDLATDHDAQRLTAAGIRAQSITTGSACHLDASMIHHALHHARWNDLQYLFIENVGNLVCPAVYDLGQAANVVLLAVTEGDDKPLKYPVMFSKANLVVITKLDLLPYLPDVRVARIHEAIGRVMPAPRVIELSVQRGEGLHLWLDWLDELDRARAAEVASS